MTKFAFAVILTPFVATAIASTAATALAEVELPRESPAAKVSQVVGLTEIAVEYTSPATKGRRIFGDVVPYGRPWSISPNQATTISFGRDVTIGEARVAAGKYRLWAIPSKDEWTFVISPIEAPGGRAGKDGDVARLRAKVHALPSPRERLGFVFADFSDDRALLNVEWERVRATLAIETNTSDQIQAGIAQLDATWRSYAGAARFMLEKKRDYDTGLRYAEQSLALHEDWYTRWIKAGLHAAKRDYKAAVEEGERARELGQQLGTEFVLEGELARAVDEWRKKSPRLQAAGRVGK